MYGLLITQFVVITIHACFWFLVALKLRRNDVADIAWGTGFIVLAIAGQSAAAAVSARGLLMLTLITLWGLRLSLYIAGGEAR